MKIKQNTVVLSGFVTNLWSNNEKTVMSFSLGVDDSYFKKEGNGGEWINRTNWINCKVFDKARIERLTENNKIDKCNVLINGEIKTNKREVEGKSIYETYILAVRIQIFDDLKENSNLIDEGTEINLSGIDDELE